MIGKTPGSVTIIESVNDNPKQISFDMVKSIVDNSISRNCIPLYDRTHYGFPSEDGSFAHLSAKIDLLEKENKALREKIAMLEEMAPAKQSETKSL